MIKITNLSVTYRHKNAQVQALAGINLEVPQGETLALIGPSGCGKTTLIYTLAGLLAPSEGMVEINGEPVKPKRRKTALILQDYGLLPWKTVYDNVALGLVIRRTPPHEIREMIVPLLENLGLSSFAKHYPAQLSGGQRQRVAIARALAIKPDLLLMDEPFSSLDALTREALQETLLEVWHKEKVTIVLVTHNIEEAVFLGRTIVVFTPSPGRIHKIFSNPAAGNADYRQQKDFYLLCTEVRKDLERGVNHAEFRL